MTKLFHADSENETQLITPCMPHALHYILIDIVGLAANFCVFRYQIISQVFTAARDRSLTQVPPRVRTRLLPSPCTLNETQKIARLYVPDGVAHGAYTHVVRNFAWKESTTFYLRTN